MLKGAHIMNGLYVTKDVWFQTGAKLFAQVRVNMFIFIVLASKDYVLYSHFRPLA